MPGLRDIFAPRAQLLVQQRRIRELEMQVASLQAENDSMREGMRRCVTCDYRIDFKQRQGLTAPAKIDDSNTQ